MSTKMQLADEALDRAKLRAGRAQFHLRRQQWHDALTGIVDATEALDSAAVLMVEEMRRFGLTWAEVGDALGISRQSAWERFSPRGRK